MRRFSRCASGLSLQRSITTRRNRKRQRLGAKQRRLACERLEERCLLNGLSFAPAAAVTFATGGGQPRTVAAGDFNGDGKPDLVAANETSNNVGVLLNTSTAPRGTARPVPLGDEFQVNTYTPGMQQATNPDEKSVAMNANGDFVVVWHGAGPGGSSTDAYARLYNADGSPKGDQFRVNTYISNIQICPSVAMAANGDFVVAWESNGQAGAGWDIYAQRFYANGNRLGSEFRVNTFTANDQRRVAVAMDNSGDFVVTWLSDNADHTNTDVYAARYNWLLGTLPSEFRVNDYTASLQEGGAVAMAPNGDFVIAWQSAGQDGSGYGVYAKRYNALGMAQGGEFRVNTYTTSDQRHPSVAMDADGDFVIAWGSDGQDGSGYGIYAQRYNAAGVPRGSEFRVNTYTTGRQYWPSVAMNAVGNFVIAWMGSDPDGGGDRIYAQAYNAFGTPQGDEFATYTYNSVKENPSVAMRANGDFVVVWDSNGQDGSGLGMYGRRFEMRGTVRPVIIMPGIPGSWPQDHLWDFIRSGITRNGPIPETLAPEPFLHTYDAMLRTYEELGYRLNENLFFGGYDWLLPIAPQASYSDDPNGLLNLSSSVNFSDDAYSYGVEYLDHWIKKAREQWDGPGNFQVDIVAHSAGGLVTRALIQSDYYANFPYVPGVQNIVHDVVMLGTPNEGLVFPPFMLLEPEMSVTALRSLSGYDYFIRMLVNMVSKEHDVLPGDVVPSLFNLLPTWNFVDSGPHGRPPDMSDYKNEFLLDLNADTSYLTNRVAGEVTLVSGTHKYTPYAVKYVSGPVVEILKSPQGDGRVQEFSAQLWGANNGMDLAEKSDVAHDDLPADADVQMLVIEKLLGPNVAIPDGFPATHTIPGITGKAVFGYFDPVDFILQDAAGRRLGYTPADGYLNEIPGAFYSGDGELEYFFIPADDATGNVELFLTGAGSGEYQGSVYYVANGNVSELNLDGILLPGQSQTYQLPLPTNMPPTVYAGEDVTINEGSTIAQIGGFIDPGSTSWTATVDFGDGFGPQALTLNSDKTFDLSHTYLDDGTYSVVVTVTDDADGMGNAFFTVSVNNVPPVVSLNGPTIAVRGQTLTFGGSFTDPGMDTWTGAIDFGDGGGWQTLALNADKTFSVDHVYTAAGTFNLQVQVADDDGGVGTRAMTVNVVPAAVEADPLYPGQNALFVGGTTGDDDIEVEGRCRSNRVEVSIESERPRGEYEQTFLGPFSRIVVYGQAGDDNIQAEEDVPIPAWLFGGEGNDRLQAGSGLSVLVGGDGNDRLEGGRGRSLLIGGRGSDRLEAGKGDAILIGGYTDYDTDEAALAAILKEWTQPDNVARYHQRVNHIFGTVAGGANGNYFLNKATVHDDLARDQLEGNSGLDWYFASLSALDSHKRDKVSGAKPAEVLTDISGW